MSFQFFEIAFFSLYYTFHVHIDDLGIGKSLQVGVFRLLKKINLTKLDFKVLLDGSLKAPKEFTQETLIRGDEKEVTIALASVVAKVSRDRLMTKLHQKYPQYDFSKHKGYGTKAHYEAIEKYGLSEIHRRSFLKKILKNPPTEVSHRVVQ